jgi:hypothetical protein
VQVQQACEAQNNLCLICYCRKPLVVDHCHETGKVRGMLCSTCNTGIGHLKDSPAMLLSALQYLESFR